MDAGQHTVAAAYVPAQGWAPAHAELTQAVYRASTAMMAVPIVVNVVGTASGGPAVTAQLTNGVTHFGVPGQRVNFSAGGRPLCSALTDSQGAATCGGPLQLVSTVVSAGYTAAFGGRATTCRRRLTQPCFFRSVRLCPFRSPELGAGASWRHRRRRGPVWCIDDRGMVCEGVRVSRVYLSPPFVTEADKAAVGAALESGWMAPAGPEIIRVRGGGPQRLGVNHAVALSSGTAALHLALLARGPARR